MRTCLTSLYNSKIFREPTLKRIIGAIKVESSKAGISPASAFVLLEWTGEIFTQVTKTTEEFNAYSRELVPAQVNLLELCLGSPHARRAVKDQALVVTRRALRGAFKGEYYQHIMKDMLEMLTMKGPSPTAKNALLLGIISGVSSRLEKPKVLMEGFKKDIYAFYVREIIGSRTLVSPVKANALHDFFSAFTTSKEFMTDIAAPLEKALLRSPEVVLNDVVTPLITSLSEDIDISESLKDKILKHLLSCLKSSNSSIRTGAVCAFTVAIARCHNADAVDSIVDEILTPLKLGKLTVVDQRQLHAQMLTAVPTSQGLAKKIPSGLAPVVIKEPNEAALGTIATALCKHLRAGLAYGIAPEKVVVEAVQKAIADKRPTVKRLWVLKLGDFLWDNDETSPTACSEIMQNFVAPLLPGILNIWNEINANPLPAAQSGLLTAGYVFIALALNKLSTWTNPNVQEVLRKADIIKQCFSMQPKVSLLLNHKVYSKITAEEDFIWNIRALSATAQHVDYEEPYTEEWICAFFYTFCAHNATHMSRNVANAALSEIYIQRPQPIGKIVINGLWQWLRKLEAAHYIREGGPASAKTGGKYLKIAINAISLPMPDNEEHVKQQLVNLSVVSHHELLELGPNEGWISICQRAKIDPGELVKERAARFVSEIKAYTALSGKSVHIRKAAVNSAATLAFVAAESITPLLVKIFQADLKTDLLKDIGETEVKIWRTPEGVLFIDPLSTNKAQAPALKSNAKDYDTLKWEAELRAQLEKKKGQPPKKLTSDEQAKVKDQLEKESTIRKKVDDVCLKLKRGVGIIRALAEGNLTGVEIWMTPALKSLLGVLVAGGGMLVGQEGVDAYLFCAEHVSHRLGPLRKFVGIAVLRGLNVTEVPEEMQVEPLTALTTRLLYRLRFTAEQRQFDIISLAFILTFVLQVLKNGGLGTNVPEETDEQIILSLEFLTYHTEACSSIGIYPL